MASKPKKKASTSVKPSQNAKKKTTRKPAARRPDEMPPDVLEFITAIDDYKRRNERPFPSWTEILEVLKGLGYEKLSKS